MQELGDLQDLTGLQKLSSLGQAVSAELTLHLPDVQHCAIQHFLVSVYSSSDIVELRTVYKGIKERIEWLKQLCELKRRRIPLLPLERSTSKQVQQQILQQLKHRHQTEHTLIKSGKRRNQERIRSDSDLSKRSRSSSPNIVTFQSLQQNKSNANISSQSHSSENCVSLTVNYKNPNTVKSKSSSLQSQSLIEIVDLNTYLHSYKPQPRKRSNTITISHRDDIKRPRLKSNLADQALETPEVSSIITNPSKFSSANEKISYISRKRYNSEFSRRHRMKMDDFHSYEDQQHLLSEDQEEKERSDTTTDEQATGMGGDANRSNFDSSNEDEPHIDASSTQPNTNALFSNSNETRAVVIACSETQYHSEANLHLKESKVKVFPSVRAKVMRLESFSQNSNAPVNTNSFVRSQSCYESPTNRVSDKYFSMNTDPNSNRLESSLEVEPSSSKESLKTDSSHSEISVVHCDGFVQQQKSSEATSVLPAHKPLVRTRTFEIIERRPQPVCAEGQNDKYQVCNISCDASSTPQNERSNTPIEVIPRRASRDIQRVLWPEPPDPECIREMERKQGSLIFEHNFQTFSNIPTTNMMTASMMTGSLSSDSSMGLASMFTSSICDNSVSGSVTASMHSDAMPLSAAAQADCDAMYDKPPQGPTPLPRNYLRRDDPSNSDNENTRAVKTLSRVSDTNSSRSASPDSLSVDQMKKSNLCKDLPETDSLMSKHDLKSSFESSTNNKEDFDDEIKEQDDLETDDIASDNDSTFKCETITTEKAKPFFQVSSGASSLFGSPRIMRRAEHTPILSGGSTLKRELSSEGKNLSDGPFDRQTSISSVKDVDSIPLVCGFVQSAAAPSKNDKEKPKTESHPQSIFSMFIDFNELPSPVKDTKPDPAASDRNKPTQPQSVYMFIEADAPHLKTKQKSRIDSDSTPGSNRSRSSLEDVEVAPLSLAKDPINFTDTKSDDQEENDTKKVTSLENDEENDTSDKKGFFMFIEAETRSTKGSPKLRRKPILTPKKSSKECSVMSKSAPSDVLLLATKPPLSEKFCSKPIVDGDEMMTKSVIDRKEYMEQPITKRNVSLNDKINESPSSSLKNIKEGFVSAIPRPIHLFKSKSSSKVSLLNSLSS